MDLQIRNKVALVLGATSGIGKAVALSLAREGVCLALAGRRTELLCAAVEETQEEGSAVSRAFDFDQGDPDAFEALIASVTESFGGIDIVVLNGGGPKAGTFLETSVEEWDHAYASLLRSMLLIVNSVVPSMRAAGWGRIVALTSTSVKEPIANLVLSNALRTALVSSLKTLSAEVARDGVTVNCIATGRILTDRLRTLYGNDDHAIANAAAREIPIGRVAQPEEFPHLVTFLCSQLASYITGQTIAIDGGLIRNLY